MRSLSIMQNKIEHRILLVSKPLPIFVNDMITILLSIK